MRWSPRISTKMRRSERVPRHHRRYPGHWNATSRVIILDKRNGALWAWSEPEQTVMYLGQIFPLTGYGPFARIIQVEPEQKAR